MAQLTSVSVSLSPSQQDKLGQRGDLKMSSQPRYLPSQPVLCLVCDYRDSREGRQWPDEHWMCTKCGSPCWQGYERGICPDCGGGCHGKRHGHDFISNCKACQDRLNPELAARSKELERQKDIRDKAESSRQAELNRFAKDASDCWESKDRQCKVTPGKRGSLPFCPSCPRFRRRGVVAR
jgi:hypothetical protein